jgi:cell division protein ZapE
VSQALHTPSQSYAAGVASARWQQDPAQLLALRPLDRIHASLRAIEEDSSWLAQLRRRFSAPERVRGLYLWGGVGRGKTFLIDLLHDALPGERKLRMHFHRFMGRVHEALRAHAGEQDPLRAIARQFAAEARLFCLDEFFVQDIGDAMILGEFLRHLFDAGATLVTTSNLPPHRLYEHGLQRERFLPAIALLERRCEVLELSSAVDYRLRSLTAGGVYHCPLGPAADAAMLACFDRLAPGSARPAGEMRINERPIKVRRRADGIAWFDFAALCEGPRAVSDYIELARSFNTVLISDVPVLDAQGLREDAAKRFIHLVDEFYDRNVNLILSAAAAPTALYRGSRHRHEFARTESRLIEMQSAEYLARPHRP